MIWFTWRQFRTQTAITATGLVALAIVLALTAHSLAHLYTTDVSQCQAGCGSALSSFLTDAARGVNGKIYDLSQLVLYAVPALIGIFWGAPLIARELETGTHRLVWNQSITRTRWLASKLVITALAALAATGLLSLVVTLALHHVDHAAANRITPGLFGARGIVPIGYTAFALILGVTVGMLIRRTVPAMAVTLAIYAAVIALMPTLRAHLLPATRGTAPLDTSRVDQFEMSMGGAMHIVPGDPSSSGWVLTNRTVTSTGHLFTGPANPQFCGPTHGPQNCIAWVNTLHLRQALVYQPDSHFWPLQFTETGIFLVVAAILAGFCFWWTRRLT